MARSQRSVHIPVEKGNIISILAITVQIDTADESWDLVLHHDLTDVNSSDLNLYFDDTTVLSMNTEFKSAETGDVLSSALYSLGNSEYRDVNGHYHFKLVYPRSLYQHEPIYWKQSTNPLEEDHVSDFQLMDFGSQCTAAPPPDWCLDFNGLQFINDNTSLLGTDTDRNDTFRVGQFAPYLVTEHAPLIYWNDSDSNATMEVQMGGIVGFKPTIDHDIPRESFEAVALYVRNQKQCLDLKSDCWLLAIGGQCTSDDLVPLQCRKSCRLCHGQSRTDLYSFQPGPSSLSQVSAVVKYTSPFHRVPRVENVWIRFANGDLTQNDTGVVLYYTFDQAESRSSLVMTLELELDEKTKYSGWKDDVTVYWNVHEAWTPKCEYHSDTVCDGLNRMPCSEGYVS